MAAAAPSPLSPWAVFAQVNSTDHIGWIPTQIDLPSSINLATGSDQMAGCVDLHFNKRVARVYVKLSRRDGLTYLFHGDPYGLPERDEGIDWMRDWHFCRGIVWLEDGQPKMLVNLYS